MRLLRRLAVGGMAEVHLAEAPPGGDPRPVVLKRLLPGADELHADLFAREARVLTLLRSPHVVRCTAAGPGWMALEHVDGTDLAALLRFLARRGRRLPLGAALAVMDGILGGLADLHDARDADGTPLGAVHRDLNPSNVLLSRDGDVKVADLGVVHLDVPGQPTVAGLKGTLAYMAPEQLLGRPVDPRTDLYAAGLVAYEALTGTPARPVGMNGIAELLEARSRLPEPPSRLRSDLPAALDGPVLAALSPDPDGRPGDARALRDALRSAAGVAPDAGALGSLVAQVGEAPARAAATLAAASREGPAGTGVPGRGPGRGMVLRRAPWVLLAAALALPGAWWLGGRDAAREAEAVPEVVPGAGHGAAPAPAVQPAAAPAPAAQADDPATGPGDPAPADAAAVAEGVPTAAAAASPPERAARPRGPVPLALEILPLGGPVHVTGAGVRGLAPLRTGRLPEGASLLTLHGGAEGMPPARVRLVRSGDALTAWVGTGDGRAFDVVRCGGRDLSDEPATGIPLQGETRCLLSAREGTLDFSMGVVRP